MCGTIISSLFQNFLLSSTQGAVRSDAISRMAWGAPALHSHAVMVLPLDYVQGARLSVVCFSHFSLLPACGARPHRRIPSSRPEHCRRAGRDGITIQTHKARSRRKTESRCPSTRAITKIHRVARPVSCQRVGGCSLVSCASTLWVTSKLSVECYRASAPW